MQYNDSAELCPDLVEIAAQVFASIPADERRAIESVCRQVLFQRGASSTAAFSHEDEEVRIYIFDFQQKLDLSARRGILAHEFAHAFDFARRRVPAKEDRKHAEREANVILAKWGYENDYRRPHELMPSQYGTIGLD